MERIVRRGNQSAMGFEIKNGRNRKACMFSTEFNESFCQSRIQAVCENLMRLPIENNYVDDRAENSPQKRLCEYVIDNVELFLYAMKNGIRVKDLRDRKTAIVRCLELASNQMTHMDIGLHVGRLSYVLEVWPNTPAWESVTLMMCWLYQAIPEGYVGEELVKRFSRSCCQHDTWKEAIESLLIRADKYPQEVTESYKWVFAFLGKYGENAKGENDRRILINRKDFENLLSPYFSRLSQENQQRIITFRNRHLVPRTRPYELTRCIPADLNENPAENLLEIVRQMKSINSEKARQLLMERYDPGVNAESHKYFEDREIVSWIGEWASGIQCGNIRSAQQVLINLMNLSRKNPDQVLHDLPEALRRYEELDPMNAKVVSGCMHMLLNPQDATDDALDRLLVDYCALDAGEAGQRRVERIWKYLLQNNNLSRVVQNAVLRYVHKIDPSRAVEIQKLRLFLQSVYPLTDMYSDKISERIPHEGIAQKLSEILECVKQGRGNADNVMQEMALILNYLLDAITARSVYRRIRADLAIFCGANRGTRLAQRTAEYIDRVVRRYG